MIKQFLYMLLSASMVMAGCESTAENRQNIVTTHIEGDVLQVHYVDVGQGDFELIEFADGEFAIIDSGDIDHQRAVMDYLEKEGVENIAFAVATHGHADHIGTMQKILENFKVEKIIRPYQDYDSTLYTNMLYAIEESGAEEIIAKYGDTFEAGGAEFEIFAPIDEEYSDFNDCSVVLKMTYGERSFLFTGDAGKASEKDMLSMGFNLKCDVLKVGHHGSRTGNTEEFLEAVSPAISIISAGADNKYGLPDEEPIERLEKLGSSIYRTDEDGTVIVCTDGEKISVYTEKDSEVTDITDITEKGISDGDDAGSGVNTENPTEIEIIGNKNSKTYHLEGCNSLPKEENRVYFSSVEEAENAGYKPHSSCVK